MSKPPIPKQPKPNVSEIETGDRDGVTVVLVILAGLLAAFMAGYLMGMQ